MLRPEDVRHCLACGAPMAVRATPRPVATCTACGRLHHLDPKVGVGALVRDESGGVLLVRRGVAPGKGLWALPAGFVDAGEQPRDAAAREVLEETGLSVRCGAVIDVYPGGGDPSGGGASFFIAFAAELLGGVIAAGDDALEAAFFALDGLPELAFASTRDCISRLGG